MHPNEENSAIFACLFPPFLAIYYAFAFLFEENSPKFASAATRKWRLIASWCNAFCSKTQCNMQQNAVHFAPKRNAICTKMQCNMHQNAAQFAEKCKVNAAKCSKNPQKPSF